EVRFTRALAPRGPEINKEKGRAHRHLHLARCRPPHLLHHPHLVPHLILLRLVRPVDRPLQVTNERSEKRAEYWQSLRAKLKLKFSKSQNTQHLFVRNQIFWKATKKKLDLSH